MFFICDRMYDHGNDHAIRSLCLYSAFISLVYIFLAQLLYNTIPMSAQFLIDSSGQVLSLSSKCLSCTRIHRTCIEHTHWVHILSTLSHIHWTQKKLNSQWKAQNPLSGKATSVGDIYWLFRHANSVTTAVCSIITNILKQEHQRCRDTGRWGDHVKTMTIGGHLGCSSCSMKPSASLWIDRRRATMIEVRWSEVGIGDTS